MAIYKGIKIVKSMDLYVFELNGFIEHCTSLKFSMFLINLYKVKA